MGQPVSEATVEAAVGDAWLALVQPSRELARRVSGGLEVTLHWRADDDSTSVQIRQGESEEVLLFTVGARARPRRLPPPLRPPTGGATGVPVTSCARRGFDERDDAPMRPAQQRVALVTGSSRGLGRAIAQRLARDGLAVAVNGLHGDGQALEVAKAIRNDGGVADAFAADVTDQQQAADLVARVTDRLGSIEVLVLNATGPQPEAPLAEVAWEDHLAQLNFFVKSLRGALTPLRPGGVCRP
jgi:short chain dehydrogenase